MAAADEQSVRDNRTYPVTRWQHKRIDRRVAEMRRLLDLTGGSPVDPEGVLDALQCIIEGRTVTPQRHLGGITLYPYDVVPVPMHIWANVAWMDAGMLGLRWQTELALAEMRVQYVGTLLLYTDGELTQHCNTRAMKDIRACLKAHGLRLPTAEELTTAKEAGFWVELPDSDWRDTWWNLRVAKDLAHLVPTLDLAQLRGSRSGFFDWAEMPALGDLLGKNEADLRELWEDYIFHSYTRGNADKEATISDEMGSLLCAEAAMYADATIAWVTSAGLVFAAS